MQNNSPINIFDFDGTLTTETWPKFWVWVKKFGYRGDQRNDELEEALANYRNTHEGDGLETFFGFFSDLLKDNNTTLSYDELMEGEKYIVYNPGVEEYIKNSQVKNYVVSGGLKEFLEHLRTSEFFSGMYGTSIIHNSEGQISGFGNIMTDNKKIDAIKEILRLNGREENDCSNVFYIGDGCSDADAMEFVHNNGGKAIFVHQPHKDDDLYDYINSIYKELNKNGIVDYSLVADYTSESELEMILNRKKMIVNKTR